MVKPKMILFDYGETLVTEAGFDAEAGFAAVLTTAVRNPKKVSAEYLAEYFEAIREELHRKDPAERHKMRTEIPDSSFWPYLFESCGIELDADARTVDRLFWDASSPGEPTDGAVGFLQYLKKSGIRTGVISNMPYDREELKARLEHLFPENAFEFILTSGLYLFRKPDRRIFDLALVKAELRPEEVWFAGDSFECDVRGALNAGLQPVWYKGEEAAGVVTVSSWAELTKILKNCK